MLLEEFTNVEHFMRIHTYLLTYLQSRVFANTMMKIPEWTIVFNKLKNVRCMAFLFVSWWMGIGMGLIFAFLFWHLQVSLFRARSATFRPSGLNMVCIKDKVRTMSL